MTVIVLITGCSELLCCLGVAGAGAAKSPFIRDLGIVFSLSFISSMYYINNQTGL